MEAVVSELNLLEPFRNQTALIGEMVQEFAPVATIIQGGLSTSRLRAAARTISI